MRYEKSVKVSKQGGTCINIPKVMCEFLDIKPGNILTLVMDTDTQEVSIIKGIES